MSSRNDAMKAIIMSTPGDPEVLQLRELAKPELTHPHEIRVHLKAAGVNPLDTKLRARGTYYPDKLPAILGCDGAGIVEQVGKSVTRFKEGDDVYFCYGGIGGHPGNYAEYQVLDERFVAHKPKTLDFNQAAAAPLVLITAWESLFDRARVAAGQKVLIHAGAGGVGHVAIQLAHAAGAEVATTISSEEKARFVKDLGATKTIDYKQVDFVEAVLEWTNAAGADMALDSLGGDTLSRTLAAVKVYGDVVTLLQPADNFDWKTARNRNQRISLELMLTPMHQQLTTALHHQANILTRCADYFDQRQLRIHVSETFPLEAAAKAHQHVMSGKTTGKVVLTMSPGEAKRVREPMRSIQR